MAAFEPTHIVPGHGQSTDLPPRSAGSDDVHIRGMDDGATDRLIEVNPLLPRDRNPEQGRALVQRAGYCPRDMVGRQTAGVGFGRG